MIDDFRGHCRRGFSNCFVLMICWWQCGLALSGHAQTPIVLRDLSVIRDATVSEFDNQQIKLSDGRTLGWDQVLQARVAVSRQAEFDANLVRIGLPLFRLKHRVNLQDWQGAGAIVEPWYERMTFTGLDVACTTEGRENSALVLIAAMQDRLARGEEEAAILPYLRVSKLLQDDLELQQIVGRYIQNIDFNDIVSLELLPIWFDRQQAELAFAELSGAFVPSSARNNARAIIYLASLAAAVERFSYSRELLDLLDQSDAETNAWRLIIEAQVDLAEHNKKTASEKLKLASRSDSDGIQIVSRFLNNSEIGETPAETAQSIMELLKIPALQGRRYPRLAAASLYQAAILAESLNWKREADSLRHELRVHYSRTFHAKLTNAALTPSWPSR